MIDKNQGVNSNSHETNKKTLQRDEKFCSNLFNLTNFVQFEQIFENFNQIKMDEKSSSKAKVKKYPITLSRANMECCF